MKLTLPISVCLCLLHLVLTRGESTVDEEPELKISTGLIKGKSVHFRGIKVYNFLTIPYAEPPVKDLRFKKPVPKKPWNGLLETNKWGPYCAQPDLLGLTASVTVTEDCLVLNVFVRASAINDKQKGVKRPRPVMVWIHGGAFSHGSANQVDESDGTPLAGLHDVIVVTVNYRLGPFGFLYLPELGIPGNMGLWDQNLALQWVRDNIEYFGGDPNRVTLFGQSAGSMSVSAHVVSPQSKGLFKNVILQSGAIYDFKRWTVADVNKPFIKATGCSSESNEKIVSCLSSFDYKKLENVDSFWPVIGDEFLPQEPEKAVASKGFDSKINVLLGTVGNEGAVLLLVKDPLTFAPINPTNLTLPHAKHILKLLFGEPALPYYIEKYLSSVSPNDPDAIRIAVSSAYGDTFLSCPTYVFGHDLVKNGHANVYAYYQSQRPSQNILPFITPSKWLPASHGDDVPMVFGKPFLQADKYIIEDVILSNIMMKVWADFAKKGKPSPIGTEKWSAWRPSEVNNHPVMILDSHKIDVVDVNFCDRCLSSWPFPFGAANGKPLTPEPGFFAWIEKNHEEL
ncbi:acetylcholinesterase-1 [Tetranychus urticae]|uniref:Carboxylic ester hydrolase n=1 Tax=Tetranychus urticae TaxID=32264 RepID=T1L0M8_TETUR|nr:acetylcholinesterase-1 [Tetranychus urticae]